MQLALAGAQNDVVICEFQVEDGKFTVTIVPSHDSSAIKVYLQDTAAFGAKVGR